MSTSEYSDDKLREIYKNVKTDSYTFEQFKIEFTLAREYPNNAENILGVLNYNKLQNLGYLPRGAKGGAKKKATSLDKLTVAELRAKAAKRKISLTGLTKKADILAKIRGKK